MPNIYCFIQFFIFHRNHKSQIQLQLFLSFITHAFTNVTANYMNEFIRVSYVCHTCVIRVSYVGPQIFFARFTQAKYGLLSSQQLELSRKIFLHCSIARREWRRTLPMEFTPVTTSAFLSQQLMGFCVRQVARLVVSAITSQKRKIVDHVPSDFDK